MAKPDFAGVIAGIVPRISGRSLYIAVAMLGATVMPHNLYLHSALVQTRRIGHSEEEKRTACKYNLIDSVVALNGAMFVNAAILILAGAVFFVNHQDVTEISQAYLLLAPLLTTVGGQQAVRDRAVLLGPVIDPDGDDGRQIIMEGFLNIRVQPWLRRLATRMLAILPAVAVIWINGNRGTLQLLILSQVVLNLQLPFAIVPLLHFTNDAQRMGPFRSGWKLRAGGWVTAVVVVALNIWLAIQTMQDWAHSAGTWAPLVWASSITVCGGLLGLLAWITLQPYRRVAPVARTLGLEQASSELVAVQTIPANSGTARPFKSRPPRAQPCRQPGEPQPRACVSAARRRRRHQPDLRAGVVDSGSGGRAGSIWTAWWSPLGEMEIDVRRRSGMAQIRGREIVSLPPGRYSRTCWSWARMATAG